MIQHQGRRSFAQVLVVLAAVVIVLTGLSLAASFLNLVLFALIFSIIFSPINEWLKHRGLPRAVALLLTLLSVFAVFGTFFFVAAISLSQLVGQLAYYATQIDGRLAGLKEMLTAAGFSSVAELMSYLDGESLTRLFSGIAAAIASFLSSFVFIMVAMLFLIAEGPSVMARLHAAAGVDQPQAAQLAEVGRSVKRQFALRAVVNAVTGGLLALWLLLLGVDFAVLWGIMTFFLSYIPYIGIVLATIPAVVLAFAEFGLSRALLVILGVAVINLSAENLLSPLLMSRGLRMSPTVVFLGFAFWTWLLGAPGAFLGMPITFFVIAMLASFPSTRWLATVMTTSEKAPAAVETQRDAVDSVA
jgi:predicted PurR-regulated permease PerM